MNLQQVVQTRSLSNGYNRRRIVRESGSRLEHKLHSAKTNLSRPNADLQAGNKSSGYGSLSHERLVYLTTCLIGHNVEVQVKDGSLISGIFHSTDAEHDFGIILKMASEIRSGPSRGQKSISHSVSKAPSKTLIIPAEELVQITAKDVSVTRNGTTNDLQLVKQQDIMIDSSISQSRHVDGQRSLERWVPDKDAPQCPELESIFDGHWNRGWDQFEVNETLFGVKSTFDEELYTTKLERGPQMRDLEREASKIAREIEGEETRDLHLAEEQGIQIHDSFDMDEETKFSSVFRGVVDSGYDENEDVWLNSCNDETFGSAPGPVVCRSFVDSASGKNNEGDQVSYCSSATDEIASSLSCTARDLQPSGSIDYSGSKLLPKSSVLESESRIQEHQFSGNQAGSTRVKEFVDKQTLSEEAQTVKSEDLHPSLRAKKDDHNIGKLSPNATSYAPTSLGTPSEDKKSSPNELSEDAAPVKTQGATQSTASKGRPGSSTSSTSECGGVASASSGLGLSPSSSVVSLSSEKSTLNPYAKEFKFNPNAKSFMPSQSPLRPASPVSDSSFYFPSVPHMPSMPVGMGVGPSFAHQPVMFNPQVAPMQSPPFFHPYGPQYGQQMILGHPRQVLYTPAYPHCEAGQQSGMFYVID